MNIAKHMEAIFVASLLVLAGINVAISGAASLITELPYVLVAANL